MFKINTKTLLEMRNNMQRSLNAINRLERLCNYKNIHPELKKDLHDSILKIDSLYSLNEFIDSSSRDRLLDRNKEILLRKPKKSNE